MYLDKINGKIYDRDIANQIFQQMSKNEINLVTIEEFMDVHI